MGRPRKFGRRKPGGRLYSQKKPDDRYAVAVTRRRRFNVTRKQSISPLAGYLCGVLYLRGKLQAHHLGHFYSFLQMNNHSELRSIPLMPKVQGGRHEGVRMMPGKYRRLVRELGPDIDVLHSLALDLLIVPVNRLKLILEKVPLTKAGEQFSNWCETQHPENVPVRD